MPGIKSSPINRTTKRKINDQEDTDSGPASKRPAHDKQAAPQHTDLVIASLATSSAVAKCSEAPTLFTVDGEALIELKQCHLALGQKIDLLLAQAKRVEDAQPRLQETAYSSYSDKSESNNGVENAHLRVQETAYSSRSDQSESGTSVARIEGLGLQIEETTPRSQIDDSESAEEETNANEYPSESSHASDVSDEVTPIPTPTVHHQDLERVGLNAPLDLIRNEASESHLASNNETTTSTSSEDGYEEQVADDEVHTEPPASVNRDVIQWVTTQQSLASNASTSCEVVPCSQEPSRPVGHPQALSGTYTESDSSSGPSDTSSDSENSDQPDGQANESGERDNVIVMHHSRPIPPWSVLPPFGEGTAMTAKCLKRRNVFHARASLRRDAVCTELDNWLTREVAPATDEWVPQKFNLDDSVANLNAMRQLWRYVLPTKNREERDHLYYYCRGGYLPSQDLDSSEIELTNIYRPPFPDRAIGLCLDVLESSDTKSVLLKELRALTFEKPTLCIPVFATHFLLEGHKFEKALQQCQWHATVMLNALHRLSEVLHAGSNFAGRFHVVTAIVTFNTVWLNHHWIDKEGGRVVYLTRRLPKGANPMEVRRRTHNAIHFVTTSNHGWISQALQATREKLGSGKKG